MPKLETNLLDALFDLDTGIDRAVFFTYRFDPTFFSDKIFPELRRRRCERALVLMDSTQYHGLPKANLSAHFGRLTLEHFPSGTLFHPKLFVVSGGGRYRCVVGSANLTRAGFEENQELFSVFSEQNGDTAGLIRLLSLVEERLHQDSFGARILRETIAELKAAEPFQVKQPSTPLVWNGLGGASLFKQIEDETLAQKLKRAVILSPYFERQGQFDSGLLAKWLGNGIKVDLYVPFDQSHNCVPRDEIAKLRKQYPHSLQLFGVRTGGKVLHAKLIGLMSTSRAWILSGSANFTQAALKGQNVEACLLFKLPKTDAESYLEHLLVDGRRIETDELGNPDENTPMNDTARIRDFMLSAVLSVARDCLTISLDRSLEEICSSEKLIIELGGKVLPLESMATSDHSIQIKSAGSYLKNADGKWEIGAVTMRASDGSAHDWRLIELSPDESMTDGGIEVEAATDLETFVGRLLNPHMASRNGLGNGSVPTKGRSSPDRNDFGDVEGQLDRAFRLSCALEAHFSYLMADPHTTYRWQGDWLRFYKFFTDPTDELGLEGRARIATQLLSCIESCFARYPSELRQWLDSDAAIRESVKEYYRQAQLSPSFSAPTIASVIRKGVQ